MSQYVLCAFRDHLIAVGPYSTLCVSSTPDERLHRCDNAANECGTSFDVNADLEDCIYEVIRCTQ
jgi:hypothetical protein